MDSIVKGGLNSLLSCGATCSRYPVSSRMRITKKGQKPAFSRLLTSIVEIESKLKNKRLPQLSPSEKASFEHSIAIDHLYYSSKIEGTHLTDKRIEKAIHGPSVLGRLE